MSNYKSVRFKPTQVQTNNDKLINAHCLLIYMSSLPKSTRKHLLYFYSKKSCFKGANHLVKIVAIITFLQVKEIDKIVIIWLFRATLHLTQFRGVKVQFRWSQRHRIDVFLYSCTLLNGRLVLAHMPNFGRIGCRMFY